MADPPRPGGGARVAGIPVPLLVAAAVVMVFLYIRSRQQAAAAASASPPSAAFPVPPTSQGIGGGAGGITSSGNGTGAFPDNQAWYSSALATLEGLGYDANSAASALSSYLSGGALNTASQGLVNIVLARIGPPPVAPAPPPPPPGGPPSTAPPPSLPPPGGRVPPGYAGNPYQTFAAQMQGPNPPQGHIPEPFMPAPTGGTGGPPTGPPAESTLPPISPIVQCPPGWYFDPVSQSCQPLNPQLGATGPNPPQGQSGEQPVPVSAYSGGVPSAPAPNPFAGINPGGAIKGYTPPPPPPTFYHG